jgi:hypothetical protein
MSKTVTFAGSQDTTYVASSADSIYNFAQGSTVAVSGGVAIDASSEAKQRAIVMNGVVDTGTNTEDDIGVLVGSSATHKGGGDLSIGASGQILAYTGVQTYGAGQTIENSGHIESGFSGVNTGGQGTNLGNTGSISSDNTGVAMWGGNSELHNMGNVDGKVNGAWFSGGHNFLLNDFHIGSTEGYGVVSYSDISIVNHSDISGYTGIGLWGDAKDVNHVTNTGHLSGHKIAIIGGDSREIIRNSGEIDGDITLGDGNDTFDNRGGTFVGTAAGGGGNDTYIVDDPSIQLTEDAHAGKDTVRSSVTFSLADNFEVLQLTGVADIWGIGNAGSNKIGGNAGDNLLSGAAGNDHLTGFGGADTFVFKSGDGHDTVTDFAAAGKHHDMAALLFDGIDSFADLKGHMSQHGHDVLLTLDNDDVLTLKHVDTHDLSAADFSFS